jgi:hypothetical protein
MVHSKHSIPNTMLNSIDTIDLDHYKNLLNYAKTRVNSLQSPHITDCDNNFKNDEYISYEECVNHCFRNTFTKELHCIPLQSDANSNLDNHLILINVTDIKSFKLCKGINTIITIEVNCDHCKRNCIQDYYDLSNN